MADKLTDQDALGIVALWNETVPPLLGKQRLSFVTVDDKNHITVANEDDRDKTSTFTVEHLIAEIRHSLSFGQHR
jgi:hypothetical protein